MVHLEQRQLILQACFALAQSVDSASDRRDPLAEVEVEPLHKGCIDSPPTSCQERFDGPPSAEDHAVFDIDNAPAPVRLDNLGLEELGQRHPSRLRPWPFVLAALGLYPGAKMG